MLIDNNTTFPQKEPQIYFNSGLKGGKLLFKGSNYSRIYSTYSLNKCLGTEEDTCSDCQNIWLFFVWLT